MKIEAYSINRPIRNVCKRHGVWVSEGYRMSPLIYLQRPAWIKDDKKWDEIVKSISLNLPVGFEVK